MAAPSKTFTVIADSDTDAESPLDTDLVTSLRDNDIHLEEWLGKNFTAAVDHDHDGANSKPVIGTSLVLLASYSPSAAASVDITSVLTSIYKHYIIKCRNLRPATDSVALLLRTSTDNGSSFDSGASDYHYVTDAKNTILNDLGVEAEGDTAINLTATGGSLGIGNGASESISCTIELIDPLETTFRKAAEFKGHYISAAGKYVTFAGVGARAGTSADVDAVQILFDSGNIASGEIRVYGMKDS